MRALTLRRGRPNFGYRWRSLRVLWRRAMSGSGTDFTRGPIGRAVFLLSVPMVLEMIMESVFAVTDIFFVSRLGPEAVAAVGLTEATVTLLYAVAIGLSMGVTAMVSRRVGEKNLDGACTVAAQALWLGLGVALLTGVGGALYAPRILEAMGASDQVVRDGAGYTAVLLGGSVTILYLYLLNAIFRGAGDAAIAMRSLWLANGINLVLDPLLIFGIGPFPELGVTGAAVATTIGRGTGVLFQLWCLFGPRGRLQVKPHHLALVGNVIRRLIRVSLGGVGQFIIATSSWVVLMKIVAEYGAAAVAGYTIAIRVIVFIILPAWGMANAAATLVGQNLGARRPNRAVRSVWAAARYNAAFLIAVGGSFMLFAEPILQAFSDDPAVIEYGVACLLWMGMGFPFYAIGMVMVQALNGAGDTDTPTRINFVCYWLLQIPLAWWLAGPMGLGPTGVFLAVFLGESLLAVAGVWAFRRGRWQTREI